MLQLNVALPSGRSETFSLLQSSKVGDLRVLAQTSFHCGFLRLVTANIDTLDPGESLQAAGLQDEDPSDSHCHTSKGSSNRSSYRIVVLWRPQGCDLGQS